MSGYSVSGKKSYSAAGILTGSGSVGRNTEGKTEVKKQADVAFIAIAEKMSGKKMEFNAGVIKAKIGVDWSSSNGGELTFKGELFGNVSGVPLKGSVEFTLTKDDYEAIKAAGGSVADFAKGELTKMADGIVESAKKSVDKVLE